MRADERGAGWVFGDRAMADEAPAIATDEVEPAIRCISSADIFGIWASSYFIYGPTLDTADRHNRLWNNLGQN